MNNYYARHVLLLFGTLIFSCHLVAEEDTQTGLRLEVIDPYLELHTGPGRGYPIFYVIEEGEFVEVLTRQPGWYEVYSQNRRIGWVQENQIGRTMQTTGEPADLPSVSYGDYLVSSWSVGFATGALMDGELDGAETIKVTAGYRPLAWLLVEAEAGKFFAPEVRGNHQSLNLAIEPLSHWRVSPVLYYGMGKLKVESQPELVLLEFDDADMNSYGLRFNYYIGRNFLINAEYRWLNVGIENSDLTWRGWYLGFNTFF